MSVDDDLRLAWQAHRDGRTGRRDLLLTLAVAEAEAEGARWVAAARDLLVASRPDHLFAGFATLDEALADRRVMAALKRIRGSFPEARVRWLVRRSEVLARSPAGGRRSRASSTSCSPRPGRAAATPNASAWRTGASAEASAEEATPILAFYLQVLLAIATLCAVVVGDRGDEKRAA